MVVNPTAWRQERIGRSRETTLTGLLGLSMLEPRVALASQPWAEGSNPLGIAQDVQTPEQIEYLRHLFRLRSFVGKVPVHGTTPFLASSSATAFRAWCSR
jgi:hypothetical protein